MSGYWYAFKIDDQNGCHMYQGRVDGTSEGWEEMGCDLYPRLHEAKLIADPDNMEDECDYQVYFSEVDLHQSLDIHDERLGKEDCCHRYLDFQGIGKDNGWQCENDCTGCLYNDGHNTCCYIGISQEPLEEE